jgi:hypothetical protein
VGNRNRQRDLPAHVVIYHVIALALYMRSSYREVLRCLLEGIQWLQDPALPLKVAGKSGISQARTRLGWEPLKRLFETVAIPIATKQTRGACDRPCANACDRLLILTVLGLKRGDRHRKPRDSSDESHSRSGHHLDTAI